ncbi:hypothetical protein PQG02_19880 [Nostoc sp. UHCC 0926]|uniref:hypothetical protein n=1 Tax=unclassified Nostoc TaxID=2593658 RepID=UPI002360FB4D|nr:hypothetical protein [Nostoc sp. UHCC 0926]WDD30989.1 hypothetical protein PQG02_19880 [Nostoc sp. UHCC 0926]
MVSVIGAIALQNLVLIYFLGLLDQNKLLLLNQHHSSKSLQLRITQIPFTDNVIAAMCKS